MPLVRGKSKSVVSRNIRELVSAYKRKGSIGTSKPSSLSQARRQAVAIALSKARS